MTRHVSVLPTLDIHDDVMHLIKRGEQIRSGLKILLHGNHAIFGAFAEEIHNVLCVLKR